MIRALRLGSTVFAAAFVVLTALGVMSLGGLAYAGTNPPPDCGPKMDDLCQGTCTGQENHCNQKTCICETK